MCLWIILCIPLLGDYTSGQFRVLRLGFSTHEPSVSRQVLAFGVVALMQQPEELRGKLFCRLGSSRGLKLAPRKGGTARQVMGGAIQRCRSYEE